MLDGAPRLVLEFDVRAAAIAGLLGLRIAGEQREIARDAVLQLVQVVRVGLRLTQPQVCCGAVRGGLPLTASLSRSRRRVSVNRTENDRRRCGAAVNTGAELARVFCCGSR
jgi:hypothetical protein